jgi:hypothetical protein
MAVLTRRLAAVGVDIATLPTSSAAAAAGAGASNADGGCPVAHHGDAAASSAAAAGAGSAAGGCPMHTAEDGSAERAAAAAGPAAAGRTILDLALGYSRGAGGAGLDVATLKDQLMTFFAAGHDTTGAWGLGSGSWAEGWGLLQPNPFQVQLNCWGLQPAVGSGGLVQAPAPAAEAQQRRQLPGPTRQGETGLSLIGRAAHSCWLHSAPSPRARRGRPGPPPAALVAWTVYYLTLNPEVERRLVDEIHSVLVPLSPAAAAGAPGAGAGPSAAQLGELKYMTCVLKETLRLRPPGTRARALAEAGAAARGRRRRRRGRGGDPRAGCGDACRARLLPCYPTHESGLGPGGQGPSCSAPLSAATLSTAPSPHAPAPFPHVPGPPPMPLRPPLPMPLRPIYARVAAVGILARWAPKGSVLRGYDASNKVRPGVAPAHRSRPWTALVMREHTGFVGWLEETRVCMFLGQSCELGVSALTHGPARAPPLPPTWVEPAAGDPGVALPAAHRRGGVGP